MAAKDPEEIVNFVLHCKGRALEQFHQYGNCMEAKTLYGIIADCGIEFLDGQSEDDTCKRLASVLMSTGKSLCSLMDYKQASYCFKTIFDVISTCRSIDDEEINILCEAFRRDLQCHFHTKDIEGTILAIGQKKPWLSHFDHHVEVNETVGQGYFDLGMVQLESSLCTSAIDSFVAARSFLLRSRSYHGSATEAKLMGSLGYCYLCNNDMNSSTYLEKSCRVWKQLGWPLDELDSVVNSLKYFAEAQMRTQSLTDDGEICRQLLQLNSILCRLGNCLKVADTFTYLGMTAFHIENQGQGRAVTYFDQALALYRQAPGNNTYRDEIAKLLRYIGVSSYNCRDFRKSAAAYTECLQLLEQNQPVNMSKLAQVAECCASLGFTYSRLRDFENMLRFYERALELHTKLGTEDLELIETNIGSLYHVKAVKFEDMADTDNSKRYYELAESAFTKALRYSWKSFPFINYGYYLYCRGHYSQAAHVLQQGYLNGVIDKDTVEFDHTEDPILIPDLKFELEDCEDVRIPSPIISLYLKVLAQADMGNIVGANHTAQQLQKEAATCKYCSYYVDGYGFERMKALSYSLLGYSFRYIGCHAQAFQAFQQALVILPDYRAAKLNLQIHPSPINQKSVK